MLVEGALCEPCKRAPPAIHELLGFGLLVVQLPYTVTIGWLYLLVGSTLPVGAVVLNSPSIETNRQQSGNHRTQSHKARHLTSHTLRSSDKPNVIRTPIVCFGGGRRRHCGYKSLNQK
jgi:hypothetical protein